MNTALGLIGWAGATAIAIVGALVDRKGQHGHHFILGTAYGLLLALMIYGLTR